MTKGEGLTSEVSAAVRPVAMAAPAAECDVVKREAPATFNINERVWVKLTKIGEEVYRQRWRRLGLDPLPLRPTSDGWTGFQLWDLMNCFGESLHLGCEVPFETTIRFSDPSPSPPASSPLVGEGTQAAEAEGNQKVNPQSRSGSARP